MKTRETRRRAQSTNATRGGILPVGGILLVAGEVVPDGTLPCDGARVSRIDYPQLFAAIGTTFGKGDGETTFDLPTLDAPMRGLRYRIRCANSPEQLEAANAF